MGIHDVTVSGNRDELRAAVRLELNGAKQEGSPPLISQVL